MNPTEILHQLYKDCNNHMTQNPLMATLNRFCNHPDVKDFLAKYPTTAIPPISPPAPTPAPVKPVTPLAAQGNDDILAKALVFTLRWEGGYCNNPADSGGATNMGVTQGTYTAWLLARGKPDADVRNITRAEVQEIYKVRYWLAAQCDRMVEPLAIVMLDTAVNFGVDGAIEFLQEATGLPADGVWGNLTEAKFKVHNTLATAKAIVAGRIAYRHERVRQNPSQRVFLQGWINRDNALEVYI